MLKEERLDGEKDLKYSEVGWRREDTSEGIFKKVMKRARENGVRGREGKIEIYEERSLSFLDCRLGYLEKKTLFMCCLWKNEQ